MKKITIRYLCPVFIQMIAALLAVYALNARGYAGGYGSLPGILLIALAGVSSALWGCVYQIKNNGVSMKAILADFFRFRADLKAYSLVAVFLLIDFLDILLFGSLGAGVGAVILLFLKSVIFGGIEELGWRYTFQPAVEKRLPYFASSLITFIFWGIWHFLFFYVDGSISAVQVVPFLSGLLANCFMLSAVYRYRKNLWLCVLTHSLINTFSQACSGGNIYISVAAKVAIIALSLAVAHRSEKNIAA